LPPDRLAFFVSSVTTGLPTFLLAVGGVAVVVVVVGAVVVVVGAVVVVVGVVGAVGVGLGGAGGGVPGAPAGVAFASFDGAPSPAELMAVTSK
jgi:hypothetical protein